MSKSFVISMGAVAVSTKTATQPGGRSGRSTRKKSSISSDSFFDPSNDVFADNTFSDNFPSDSALDGNTLTPKGRMPRR